MATLVFHPPLIHTAKKRRSIRWCFPSDGPMYPILPCYIICFHRGKRNLKRNIPVQPAYNKLGHRHASAIGLVFLHGQRWSDMSGRFTGRTSEEFMDCDDDDILSTLESLDQRDLSKEGYTQFERFVCQLYMSKGNDFRWFLYPNSAAEGRVFPQSLAH